MQSRQTPRRSEKIINEIGIYAVQCGLCFKWTKISTKEEYETIRHCFTEDPWFCSKKPGGSCEAPADLEYDTSRMWIIDKPNIPKPPPGFERELVGRGDLSKFDAYYVTPTGKRVRSPVEVQKFINENPKYKDLTVSDFIFSSPKIPKEMLPPGIEERGSASAKNKKLTMDASAKKKKKTRIPEGSLRRIVFDH